MASHHLLTSRRPRSDLLVDRDVLPVEFDRHNALASSPYVLTPSMAVMARTSRPSFIAFQATSA